MTHSLRFRSGQVQLRTFRTLAGDVINPGDLLVQDGPHARPASSVTWTGTAEGTRASASEAFIGVAHSSSQDGEADPISVDVSAMSVYEVTVRSGTFEVGDLLGLDADNSLLMADRLDAVADPVEAIARAAEFTPTSADRLRVTFASSVNTASANAAAQIG